MPEKELLIRYCQFYEPVVRHIISVQYIQLRGTELYNLRDGLCCIKFGHVL